MWRYEIVYGSSDGADNGIFDNLTGLHVVTEADLRRGRMDARDLTYLDEGQIGSLVYEIQTRNGRPWTVDTIKAELPQVRVKFGDGTTALGTIAGRKLPFPEVHYTLSGSAHCVEVAWPTLAHVLNAGTAVLV